MEFLDLVWTIALAGTIFSAISFVGALFTLPSKHSLHSSPHQLTELDFDEESKESPDESGYAYYQKHKDKDGQLKSDISVQIVVLGDIGRSPRMQYHALSVAQHGGKVDIVGYHNSEVHPDIIRSRFIDVVPIRPWPSRLQTNSKVLFLLFAPFKVLWQFGSLYYALGYQTEAAKYMLVQNPPSIPTLAIARLICYLRSTRLVIDWHNFGYSILALRLGPHHPLVRVSEWYERFFSASGVYAHFCVTHAMAKVLEKEWGITNALTLHDRPPNIYQPLGVKARSEVLRRLPGTEKHALQILDGRCRLLVSSTSWTPDEDFSILLDALVQYSTSVTSNPTLPPLIAIITGRGPQRDYYLNKINDLTNAGKLQYVLLSTAWLSPSDYAGLLGSADLGVSLHTSSSGVDLPMKVVDMFGTGLPVVGWSAFEAWPELVQEGVNGRGFNSANQLAEILRELFGGDGQELARLREGAMEECKRRWNDEWMPVAGNLFQLKGGAIADPP